MDRRPRFRAGAFGSVARGLHRSNPVQQHAAGGWQHYWTAAAAGRGRAYRTRPRRLPRGYKYDPILLLMFVLKIINFILNALFLS